jgi:carbamoyltransferase
LYAWHGGLGKTDRFIMDHTYWGQQYTEAEIKSSLDEAGLSVQEFNSQDELVNESVDRLTSGKVIGWFQGKFEWGPRALGNRSILADPRRAEMKDIVNTKIKFREPFRPFAPAVTLEAAPDFFDIPETANGMPERFMLLVVPVWETKSDQIPAVSHLGTARVQVVHHEANPLYSDLIATFGDATGTPVLMNTSFNIRGEPIVSSPEDAIRTFGNSGIDTLVIGNFLVEK